MTTGVGAAEVGWGGVTGAVEITIVELSTAEQLAGVQVSLSAT